jgi:hypothetical protein
VRAKAPIAVVLITWGVSVAMVAFLTVGGLSLKAPTFPLAAPAFPSAGGAPIRLSALPSNPFGHAAPSVPVIFSAGLEAAASLTGSQPPLPPPPPSPTPCRTTPRDHRSHMHMRRHMDMRRAECTVPPCVWTHRCHRHHPRHAKGWPGVGMLLQLLHRLWWINDAWPVRSDAPGRFGARQGGGPPRGGARGSHKVKKSG